MQKLSMDELQRKTVDEFKKASKTPIIIILDSIRSLHNIGSVFRTADAFLIEKIYLCGITAVPPNKEIHKTALGATETVEWEYVAEVSEVVKKLQEQNITVVAIEQAKDALFLNQFIPNRGTTYALVFGNEVMGVSDTVMEQANLCIEIPQLGSKHSLNISVSTGIVVWDFFNKIQS